MRMIISVRPFVLFSFSKKIFSRYPFIFNHCDCNKLVDYVFYAWCCCALMLIAIQLQKVLLVGSHPLSSSVCSWVVTSLSSHISRLSTDPPKKCNHVCLIATKVGSNSSLPLISHKQIWCQFAPLTTDHSKCSKCRLYLTVAPAL